MRVAVVSMRSPDYLIDVVADGLIRELGRRNVHLHYKTWHLVNNYRYTHLMKGFFGPQPFPIEEADVLVASTRESIDEVRAWKAKTGQKTVAVLDGEDHVIIQQDYLVEARVYFKREFTYKREYPSHVVPLPFGAIPEPIPEAKRPRQGFFFRGHFKSHRIREPLVNRLKEKFGFTMQEATSKERYNEDLVHALVGISVRGYGWDTYRYWEIPYFGACLLSERLGIIVPENFVDGVEAVFFQTPDELEAKIRELLADPPRAQEIARRGRKACLERHMSVNRARRVLGCVV